MRRIVIDMQNCLFADAIEQALVNFDSDFEPHLVEKPSEIEELCRLLFPYALIMEVSSYKERSFEERMIIRKKVKKTTPNCKIVLVVDENTEKLLADRVRQAKKDGIIDNFVYGSVSATYLSAVIDTL